MTFVNRFVIHKTDNLQYSPQKTEPNCTRIYPPLTLLSHKIQFSTNNHQIKYNKKNVTKTINWSENLANRRKKKEYYAIWSNIH